jgi:hypothetical protein
VRGDAASIPLIGRATVGRDDGRVLLKASIVRIGFFNQPRLLLYCALVAMLAAALAIEGYGRTPKVLSVAAAVLFVLAIWAGQRTSQTLARRYAHGQEREIVLSDETVEVREPGFTFTQAWSRFECAYETRDHLVLLAGPAVTVVPLRAFAPADVDRVRALVTSKVQVSRI